VPASVLFAAAVQLKRNMTQRFAMKEKVEVETILHLVGHYTSLGAATRCHVRERVHYYLKKLQSDLLNNDKPAPKKKKKVKQAAAAAPKQQQQQEQTGGDSQNPAESDAMNVDSFFS
jgi:hypothetical protein